MLRKLFARPHQEEVEDADSVAPFIIRRSRSEEANSQRLGDEEMPDHLREQWKQLKRKHEDSSAVGFLRKAADTLREDYEPPSSFTQFVLVTLKDEVLPYDISFVFDLLQLCIARDRSRVCLQSDTAEIVMQSYRRYFTSFQEQPTAENCEIFFHAGQALYALGLLALVHLSDSHAMGKVRDEVVVWLQAGLMAINTEVGLQKVASTQFVCFSTGRAISQCFRPQFPQVDLSLVLLSHLLTLTQSSSNLPATLRAVLPHQLRSLQAGFRTVEPSHLLCLLDKTLVTLHFLTAEMRRMKSSAVLENCEMLSSVIISFCWTYLQWASVEHHERLSKLFALLEQIYDGLSEAGEELIPLKLLQPMEEWGAVEGEAGRDMYEQVMKLVGNYLKHFSEARVCDAVLRSGFLSVLLSPFFLLNSSSLETQTPALRLVLLSRDGRVQFLQEFIKGFHQYKDQLAYVSKLSSLLSELVTEERDWVNLLSEQHFMDYLYQVLLETDLQPLQVCVTSLLRVPKLAASLLEQPSVLHTAVRFLGSDFGLELWARFLSCNASDRAYRHFVRLLSKEQSEQQVRQLFCTLEIALESQDRQQSQALFIKHSVLKVAVKRLGDFTGTGLTLVALPALRLLLYRCGSAQAQLRTLGFTPLKKELLAALDCLQLPGQVAELESLLDNLLFMLLDSTDLRIVTVVRLPELAEVVLRAVLRLSEEAQLRYISIIHSICSLQVNALLLSNEGAIKPALHFFSITPNTPIRCLLLDILASMMKESLRPCDLVALIQCLNDDSKASYPSKLTKDLLELLKKTFETQEEIGWRFEVQPGGYLETNAAFPRRKGCTVFLWVQLKAPTSPRLLLSLTHSFPGRQLYLRVAPSGALTVSLSAAGNTQTFDCGLLPWAKLTLISVTFSTKKGLFKVAVDGQAHECRLSEGHIQESAFECMRIGSPDDGFEGQVAGGGLFLTALSCLQLQELQHSGPTFFSALLDQQVNYLSEAIRCSRLAEAELAVCMHPAYISDAEHAVNVARKGKSLDATLNQESGQELTGNPLLRSVIAVPRTRVSDALSCVGGLPVLLPLLSRVEKKHHVKEILHQLLEITTQYCRFSPSLAGEHLIATLRLRLESVAKRFPLKTSTAILLNHLKDALITSKQLQRTMVLSLILNQTIWEKSKRTVRKLLILVNYSSIFQSDEERVTLISRLIRFAVPDVESSSDYAANVRKMVKTYAEEGEDRFYELLVTELLEALVEQEDQEAVVSLLLKLLVFLSKRGKVAPSEKLMLVLLYLLDKDREKARNYTKKVLHIVKLAYCKCRVDPLVLSAMLPALNQHLKACLAPCDFQALLSLMICVPSLSPTESFALPELPIKSSFTTVLSTYEDVILRHPQVMDLITHRLAAYPSQQALEDFVRVAECKPQAVFDQTSFPDWTLPLLCAGQQTELLGRLVAVSCGRAMLQAQGAWKKCARLFDTLSSEQQVPLLERLTKETLEVMEESGEQMEKTQFCRANLHYFSYLIEDFCTRQQGRIDRNMVLGFVQVIAKAKLLSDTQPSVPAISLGEAMKCYKYDNIRGRFDPREGGTLRIVLTVLFQSFRHASDSELAQLLPFLKLFLKPFPGKQRSASIVDPKAAKSDLLSRSDFVSCLVFAELSDILISRRNEESVITVLSAVIQGLNDYSGLIEPLKRLCEGLSLEDHYDTKQFLQVYGVVRLGSARESTRPAQNAGWWERDSFEITKQKLLDKVHVVLRPAFSSGALGRILLTEDWVESVHPFYLLNSSGLLTCTASSPSAEPIAFTAPRKLTSPFLPDLSVEIPKIAKARFQMRKAEECDYLYQHTQWHAFKKWQTREAGLWVRSHPSSPVWKLDPEMDLEYRSLRLKVMQRRAQGYYQDKAHKKTISQLNQVVAKRRFSRDGIQPITPSRPHHTQTVLITNESPENLLELLLLKADSCPPATPTQSTQTLPAPGRGQHECERIQAKGASFGSLEVTSRYVIFRCTGACKCDTRDYFGSAPVPFT